jgi:simple sugar transport system substrate-binding protein
MLQAWNYSFLRRYRMRRNTERILVLALLVLIALPTFAGGANEKGKQEKGKQWEIVTVVKLTGIPWFNRMEEGVKQAAKDLGVNAYEIGPADADPAQQVKMVDDLISKGVDAICVTPNDSKALEPVFARAKAKGILVLTHESPEQVGKVYDIELADDLQFAHAFWDKLVEIAGDSAKYVVFVGGLTVPSHNRWTDAGLKYAKDKYPKLQLVTDRIPIGEDQQLGYQKTLELITDYPDLKGIISFVSPATIGMAQALKVKGLAGKVALVGTAIPNPSAPYFKDDSISWGFLWVPKNAGYSMTWVAKQVLDGRKITDGMEVPGVGKLTVVGSLVKVDAIMQINKQNVDSYGF